MTSPPCDFDDVLIIGGGFSGTMLAIGLLRHGGPRAVLIERAPGRLGRGVAYGAAHADLLLNVRAANMSAFGADPGHFLRWLGGDAGEPFVARDVYGRYLRETLQAECRARPGRLRIETADIVRLEKSSTNVRAVAADGRCFEAAAAVLALGNLPPRRPPEIMRLGLPGDVAATDPWATGALDRAAAARAVVLLGSGLTAVDVLLALEARGHAGRIVMVSRHGLLPLAHDPGQPPVAGRRDIPAGPPSRLIRETRARAAAIGWRGAVDELRPITQLLWSRARLSERASFLRHGRTLWDIHRHRTAPEVSARVEAARAEGRLRVLAGRVTGWSDGALRVRARGSDVDATLPCDVLINCTGHPGGVSASDAPLLTSLLASGLVRSDALDLGLDADTYSRTIDRAGQPNDRLFCVGPLTRGKLWEIVAVPDLRMQADQVARRLSNAHWVGGEGL